MIIDKVNVEKHDQRYVVIRMSVLCRENTTEAISLPFSFLRTSL